MAEKFDPYHVWLGIPPEEQPPNHYRLLGLRSFEPNLDVIENLADQRMTHLRTFQTSKNAALSQKLLNEVSAARICLLNSKTKQQYDQQLRTSLAAAAKPPAPPANLPVATPLGAAARVAPPPAAAAPSAPIATSSPSTAAAPSPSPAKLTGAQPKRLSPPIVAAVVAITLVLALGVGFIVMNSNGGTTADRGSDPGDSHGSSPDKAPNAQQASKQATLKLNVAPADRAGVSVLVDDVLAKPPGTDVWELPVAAGQHHVKAVRPGYMPFEATVSTAAGERLSIDPNWQAIPKVVIRWPEADRSGGHLFIDNEEKPIASPELEFLLSPGHHLLRIVRPGFRMQTGTFELAAGDPLHTIVPVWTTVPVPIKRDPAKVASISPSPMPPTTNTAPKPAPKPSNTAPAPDRSATSADTKSLKAAIPDDAEQAKALKNVQEIYRDQLKQAVAPDQKLALAKTLQTEGLATKDDPAGRFVLLKMARDLDASQGDLDAANEIIDHLASDYDVAALDMKNESLIVAAKSSLSPAEYSAKLNAFADEAAAADRFDLAKRAVTAAIKLKVDPPLHKQFVTHQKEIGEIEAEYHRLKPARDTLETNSDDPDANLAVGKFDCLVKGDFTTGLPLLAKGSDKTLAELAKLDLAQSVDATEEVQVADGWWATGKKPAMARAKQLYEGALPRLTGIARTKVEKRIQEFESKAGVDAWTNLLKVADPTKYVFGQWTKGANGLECAQPLYANAIEIPFDPGPNYEVKLEFTRLTGTTTGDIALYLPVNGGHCRVVLGKQGRYGGIDTVDGRELYDRLNPTARPAKLENNIRCQLDVVVRTNGTAMEILVFVNGQQYTSFRGQASQLGMSVTGRLPATAPSTSLGLGAQSSTAVFHSVQYRKLPPPGGR